MLPHEKPLLDRMLEIKKLVRELMCKQDYDLILEIAEVAGIQTKAGPTFGLDLEDLDPNFRPIEDFLPDDERTKEYFYDATRDEYAYDPDNFPKPDPNNIRVVYVDGKPRFPPPLEPTDKISSAFLRLIERLSPGTIFHPALTKKEVKVAQTFWEAEIVIKDIEERMGRAMTETQRQGLRNSGSLMFLEAMTMGFYYAKTPEAVEEWLKEIDGFKRG